MYGIQVQREKFQISDMAVVQFHSPLYSKNGPALELSPWSSSSTTWSFSLCSTHSILKCLVFRLPISPAVVACGIYQTMPYGLPRHHKDWICLLPCNFSVTRSAEYFVPKDLFSTKFLNISSYNNHTYISLPLGKK